MYCFKSVAVEKLEAFPGVALCYDNGVEGVPSCDAKPELAPRRLNKFIYIERREVCRYLCAKPERHCYGALDTIISLLYVLYWSFYTLSTTYLACTYIQRQPKQSSLTISTESV